jgi:hypothetical protein
MLHCYLDRYVIPAEQAAFSSAGLTHGKLERMLMMETAGASKNIIKANVSYLL